jgi:hypothetical protein
MHQRSNQKSSIPGALITVNCEQPGCGAGLNLDEDTRDADDADSSYRAFSAVDSVRIECPSCEVVGSKKPRKCSDFGWEAFPGLVGSRALPEGVAAVGSR